MQAKYLLVLAFAGSVAACREPVPPTGDESHAIAPAADSSAHPAVQCPSRDFDAFLKSFANRVDVQKVFTKTPYTTTVYDPGNLEGEPIVSQLAPEEIQFPILLDDQQRREHGVSLESARKAADWFEVSTRSDGSGAYTMTFNFRFQNGCWRLTDSVDAST